MALDLQKIHTTAKTTQDRIPEGTYMGRLTSIVDLGIQPQTDWKTGEVAASKPRVLFTWELPTEKFVVEHTDGTTEELPRWISKEYTLSADERSNLFIYIAAMRPGTTLLEELLDMPCMVNIGSTITGNAKVVSVMPAPDGVEVDRLATPPVNFDFDEPSESAFLSLPLWLQKKVKDADNYNGFADEWASGDE